MERMTLWSLWFLISVDLTCRCTLASNARRTSVQRSTTHSADGVSSDLSTDDENIVVHLNCSIGCTTRDAIKQLRMDGIRRDILRMLGMTSPPVINNNTVHPDIPLLRRHDLQQHDTPGNVGTLRVRSGAPTGRAGSTGRPGGGGGGLSHEAEVLASSSTSDFATTLSVVCFAERVSQTTSTTPSSAFMFSFDRDDVRQSDITQASFGVHMRRVSRSGVRGGSGHSVQRIVKVSKVNRRGQLEFYNKTRVHFFGSNGSSQWVTFDVTQLVVGWVNDPVSNQGLVVSFEDDASADFVLVTPPISAEDRAHTPYIEVNIRARRSPSRARRTVNSDCNEHSSDRLCCRYPLTINFDDFHWDWIIAPRQYSAFYCSGECPFVFMRTNPHTYLVEQSTVNVGGPCCTPKSVSPISLLYYDAAFSVRKTLCNDHVRNVGMRETFYQTIMCLNVCSVNSTLIINKIVKFVPDTLNIGFT